MALEDPLPTSDVLVVAWPHSKGLDDGGPIWPAVRVAFGVGHRVHDRVYDRRFHPTVEGSVFTSRRQARVRRPVLARYVQARLDGGRVCLFAPTDDLLTGPTALARALVETAIAEVKPSLVLSVGLGAAVLPNQQVGDVVCAYQARLDPVGAGGAGPVRTSAGQLPARWSNGLTFGPLREPALRAPTPFYNAPPSWPRPQAQNALLRVAVKPLLSRPAKDEHGIGMALSDGMPPSAPGASYVSSLSAVAEVTDVNSAILAEVCTAAASPLPFALFAGLATPLLICSPDDDDEQSLRDAWANYFLVEFSAAAAVNAARAASAAALAHVRAALAPYPVALAAAGPVSWQKAYLDPGPHRAALEFWRARGRSAAGGP
ncbi:MAG TPA: hypothetical protein VFX49_03765 [Chloroflexota bacterium]|nr:hypothetical protein [Chloroflexota bacterium]